MLSCPLKHYESEWKNECNDVDCAWYDKGNKCCAILAISLELINLGEKI